MQFVWFYVPAPDNGRELFLSMKSVERNFSGSSTFTVIGDKPSWYEGHFIPSPKYKGIRDAQSRMPFRDTQHKIIVAASHPEIEEEFVWIMDDVYFLKPVTIEDLRIVRYDPWFKQTMSSVWRQMIRITFAALKRHGKPNFQVGTHLPHVFQKEKLRSVFDLFGFPRNLLLFEILYGNFYCDPGAVVPYAGHWNGVDYPKFLRRLLKKIPDSKMNEIDASVLNYQSHVWGKQMNEWLEKKLA